MSAFNPFGKNTLSSQSYLDIQQICDPLFKELNLSYFHYFRVYQDGSAFAFFNRMDCNDYYYAKKFKPAVPLPKQQIQYGKYHLCLWRGVMPDQMLADARNLFNFDHPFGIAVAHKDYFEAYAFGTHQGNDNIVNTYFNNIEKLINFTNYFKNQAAPLLAAYEKEKFIWPTEVQPDQIKILDNLSEALTLTGNYGPTKFTLKELEAFRLLCRGLTQKEIADTLQRSPRTIEMHVRNIKNKLGCTKRSELMVLALKNNVHIF